MIELLTAATPNGHKISIVLEELGLEYQARRIDLNAREQKQSWFLALNPNGRIPVIIDQDNDDFVVFESGAILMYLAERENQLMSQEPRIKSQTIQWLMFQMGGLGPTMGQAKFYSHYAKEKIPYATNRYQRETQRLLEVLNHRLEDREYLINDYSIADIANFAWARDYDQSATAIEHLPNFKRWLDSIASRPAVVRGLAVP